MVEASDPAINIPIKSTLAPQPANLVSFVSQWWHELTPTQGVITAGGEITGTYRWIYTTGNNEWVELNSLRLIAVARGANAQNVCHFGGNEIGALIQRATFYVGNIKISESNNYPWDALTCKLISYTPEDLAAQGFAFTPEGDQNGQVLANGEYVVFEDRLDGLWIPNESNVIPPNTHFALEVQTEPQHEQLMSLGATNVSIVKTYLRWNLKFHSFVRNVPVPQTHVIVIQKPVSFRTQNAVSYDETFQINQNCTRISVLIVDTAGAVTPAGAKTQGVAGVVYDDFLAAHHLTLFNILYGSQNILTYNVQFNTGTAVTTYREIWREINETLRGGYNRPLTYAEWILKPFYTFPVIKSIDDRGGSQIRVRINQADIVANSTVFVCCHIQNIIKFMFDPATGTPVAVEPSVP